MTKMKLKFLAAVGLAATLYSCDDTTTGVGEFVADADEITASAQTFEATTKTLKYTDLNQNGVFSRTSKAVHTWVNSPIRILVRIPPISSHKSIARKVSNFRKQLKKL